MKRNIIYIGCFLLTSLLFTACVNDLNTEPINDNSSSAFNQDAMFTKIYATLGTTGQGDGLDEKLDKKGDIDGIDEGTSAFYRMSWELNEFPTDEGLWIWSDPGVDVMRTMEWDGENDLVEGLYYRFVIDIKYCNHFLENADLSDEKGQQQAAEVRFIRALNYWYLLDMFKFIPFSDHDTRSLTDYLDFYSRPQLFEWLETELKDLTNALPATRLSKFRVDQTAAWLLLARLYLNAEVYTGTARWQDAQNAADQAINSGYQLHTTPVVNKDGVTYTAYQQLFMGDNDLNGAEKEAVLLIYQDGFYCRCYGGGQFTIASVRDGGMVPWGASASWKCFRSSPTLVEKFFDLEDAASIKADEYHMWEEAKDDRAIFCSYVEGNTNTWQLKAGNSASDAANFYLCWACPKFTALYSTTDSLSQVFGSHSEWPDTDIPLMRIAEAYLTKAEAMFRLGDAGGAMNLINTTIRQRAHATPLLTIDEQTLCDEWSREFWGEGRRRTDLIRFNRFAGPKADQYKYHWELRANTTIYKSMEEKWNWFPIPSTDKRLNPNYAIQVLNAEGALEGGDGYSYASGN